MFLNQPSEDPIFILYCLRTEIAHINQLVALSHSIIINSANATSRDSNTTDRASRETLKCPIINNFRPRTKQLKRSISERSKTSPSTQDRLPVAGKGSEVIECVSLYRSSQPQRHNGVRSDLLMSHKIGSVKRYRGPKPATLSLRRYVYIEESQKKEATSLCSGMSAGNRESTRDFLLSSF